MGFYDEWIECIENNKDDIFYVKSFLYCSVSSIESIENGSEKCLMRIVDFLTGYDKNRIINIIDDNFIKIITSVDVIQFSNFKIGTEELTHLLSYEKKGLTFNELGYLLIDASSDGAAEKYGENHAKVAKELNLVSFSKEKPYIVHNTRLGDLFPYLNDDKQNKLISILSLRDPLIMTIIAKAKHGKVEYCNEVECLADSTKLRRKSNVKYLIDLALTGIDDDFVGNINF
ncbi:MAG: hypothetical protein RR623_05955 [Bacilli bacterium]